MSGSDRLRRVILIAAAAVTAPAAGQAGQAGQDAQMAALAAASPIDRAAREEVAEAIAQLGDPVLREQTRAALFDPRDCIRSRAGLDAAGQTRIVRVLQARGWIDPTLPPERARTALFPPVLDDGGACPHLGFAVLAGPGGNSGSHHSWPGGLAVHLAINLRSAASLTTGYAAIERAAFDRDRVAVAILWHDWAKALVLRWRADGETVDELAVAGTGAHHVLGLAEAMRRGFRPERVADQACALDAAVGDRRMRVQDWLDAAALIARVDGRPYRAAVTPACLLNHLADQNWEFSDEAAAAAEAWLRSRAATVGIDATAEPARFRRCLLIPTLAWIGAERIYASLRRGDADALLAPALAAVAPVSPCNP